MITYTFLCFTFRHSGVYIECTLLSQSVTTRKSTGTMSVDLLSVHSFRHIPPAVSEQSYVVETFKIFVTTKPTSFRALESVVDFDPKSSVRGKTLSGDINRQKELGETLEAFDSPQKRDRAINESNDGSYSAVTSDNADSTPPRPLYLESVNGTEKAWQTKDITIHIYLPGTRF